MDNWLKGILNTNFVLNSNVSISRNIKDILFVDLLDNEKSRNLVSIIENLFLNNKEMLKDFSLIKLWENNESLIGSKFERFLISKTLFKNYDKGAFILNKDETIVLSLNEKEHLKISYITESIDFKSCFDEINLIDDFIENNLDYAFDEKLGYLSSNLTNLGTGINIKMVIHLPALRINNKIIELKKEISSLGFNIEELYKGDNKYFSNIYEIYNENRINISENDIIYNFDCMIKRIIIKEIQAREILLEKQKFITFNKIFRALGILKNSYLISLEEALELLSYVRMGVEMSIINNISKEILNRLLVNIQFYSLELELGKNISKDEIDIERASYIRNIFANNNI